MKTRQHPSTKPYYKCFSCPDFRKVCGGLPTRELDLKNWCEYIRDVMDFAHLTNAHVAKEAEVSARTMERISAINDEQDIMRATARRIEMVVLGPVGRHICQSEQNLFASAEQIEKMQAEAAYWKAEAEIWKKENDRKAKIIDKYLDN